MKKFLIILIVVLTNVFSVVATPVNNFKINYENVILLSNSNNKQFEDFNDSILIYDKINFAPIYKFLQLNDNQYEEFYYIHKDVYNAINNLSIQKENGVKTFNNHMKVDLKNSYCILNKEQYGKYIRIINITLAHKDLSKYLY